MDTNRTEKTLQVSIYMYLIKKGNEQTARVFREEVGLTSEDLELHVGPDFLLDGWNISFDDSDFPRQSTSATSVAEPVKQRAVTMPNPNTVFLDNFIDLDPLWSYPSSSACNQILPTLQEDLANNLNIEVGLKKPSPLNLGTPGILSSYSDGARSNSMSMNSSASTFEQQRALTLPNPNMAFVDNFIDLDPLSYPSSAGNQILPTPQEDLANNHNKEVGLERPNPPNMGTPKFRFSDTYFSQHLPSPTSMQNSVAEYHNIEVGLKRPILMNLGTPGILSSYSDGARSNSMSMNSSASAGRKISNKQILNTTSQRLSTEKRKAMTEPTGMGEPISKIIKSANNRSSLQEIQKVSEQLICCDFSSDGEILACISKDRTVWLWNMKNNSLDSTPKRQFHPLVMDVRFASRSSHLAAYNLNKTVELWDAKNPKEPLCMFSPKEPLTSMDFNPRNRNQLCCADKYDIHLWNVKEQTSEVFFKGGAEEVRFQPGDGNMLAAIPPTFNIIRLFDVQTKSVFLPLEGHGKRPLTVCWDISGKYIASVSEDQALIWSVYESKKPIYELRSTGKTFQSCTPHPKYPKAFVIGSYQSLEVWNPSVSNATESINAHSGYVYALCSSSKAGLIASTSDDNCLKLWK